MNKFWSSTLQKKMHTLFFIDNNYHSVLWSIRVTLNTIPPSNIIKRVMPTAQNVLGIKWTKHKRPWITNSSRFAISRKSCTWFAAKCFSCPAALTHVVHLVVARNIWRSLNMFGLLPFLYLIGNLNYSSNKQEWHTHSHCYLKGLWNIQLAALLWFSFQIILHQLISCFDVVSVSPAVL